MINPKFALCFAGWAASFAQIATSNCDFSGHVILPDGEQKGESYNPKIHPPQDCFLQATDSGRYSRFILAKPVQDGGTLSSLIPMLRRAIHGSQTILLAYPSMDLARDIWTMKVRPILRLFGGGEIKTGGGSHGGAARVMGLPSGGQFLLRTAGGRGESGQASVTADAMLVDEVDDWPTKLGLEKIAERMSRARDPMTIYICTVKKDKDSHILALYDEGTQTRIEYPCPACGAFQPLEWERVDTEAEVYSCVHCSAALTETQRLAMLPHWKRADKNPKATTFSIRWTALDSPFSIATPEGKLPCLPALCLLYRRAKEEADKKSNYAPMRAFYHDRLTRVYEQPPAPEAFDHFGLAKLSDRGTYYKGEVPAWVKFLTAGVDVQNDRHYCCVLGHGAERRWCIIDWWYEHLCTRTDAEGKTVPDLEMEPSPADRVRVMDSMARRCREGWSRQGESGDPLRPAWCIIDTGWKPEEIYPWLASGVPDWAPAKGVGSSIDGRRDIALREGTSVMPAELAVEVRGIMDITKPPNLPEPLQLWNVHGSAVRMSLQSGLQRQPGVYGSGELPLGLTPKEYLLQHLCAEIWTQAASGKWYWRQAKKSNHLLDCAIYALAAGWLEAAYQKVYAHLLAPRTSAASAPPETPQAPPEDGDPRAHYGTARQQDRNRRFSVPMTTPDGRPYHLSDR